MAVNSRFMLPPQVLQMEQGNELLSAEDAEINLLMERITHEKNQLYLCSADEVLPRLEHIYALPVNSEYSVEARRRRLLSKHNARGICTPETLRETVLIITGNTSEILEHFSEGYFSVIVHMPLNDGTDYLRELISQITEQRPAHLLFETVAGFGVISGSNRQAPHIHSVDFHTRVDNLGVEIPRFNGWHQFGRAIRFGGQITKGLKLYELYMSIREENPWKSETGTIFLLQSQTEIEHSVQVGSRVSAQNREAGVTRAFSIQSACRNTNNHPATLTRDSLWEFGQQYKFDGKRRFNGAGYTKEEI